MSLRLALILGAAAALLIAGAWISSGFWKPALDRAVAAAFSAQDEAAAKSLEAKGAAANTKAVERWADQRAAAADTLSDHAIEARSAPDAAEPLDPDRRRRLSELDDRMCELRPILDGCGPAAH